MNDGSVLLTGNIETFEKKLLATQLAWEVNGVREVINEVSVAESKGIKDIAKDLAAAAELRAKVWPLLESGQVKPVMDSVFDLSEAADAHAHMESNAHIGKIVLKVGG